jgi:serine/threonine-protein kinase
MTDRDIVVVDETTGEGLTLPRTPGRLDTLASPGSVGSERQVDTAEASLTGEAGDRYAVLARLGEGGMGEVNLCLDQRIGRDVAMKVMHKDRGLPPGRARFEREARVQGQLDHPAVVPVYDLGLLPDGTTFFTMKRVRGLTLADILHRREAGDESFVASYSLRRLLTALSSVCLALSFAHDRGVVHRDVKPGNIMLGAYGEVYLLDWGVAKVGTRASSPELDARVAPGPEVSRTIHGEFLGTPGYMAPEQARGDAGAIDARADVYAIGVVLFEMLAGQPLIEPTTAPVMLAATLGGVDARLSRRAPGRVVAPELEAICVRATALDPAARFASARELHDELERYLAGDLDVERRRAMADEHAARAESAEKRLGGADEIKVRARALREATSALTLDPGHAAARATLMRLLLTVPAELPPEARAAFAASRAPVEAAARRSTLIAYLVWLAFSPLAIFSLGVRSWPLFLATPIALAVGVVAALAWIRRPTSSRLRIIVHVAGAVAVACVSLQFSPLLLVPSLAAALTIAWVLFGDPRWARIWAVIGGAAFLVPWLLEVVGVLPPSIVFRDGAIVLLPRAVAFPEGPTTFFLAASCLTLIVGPMLVLWRARARAQRSEEKVFHHAWTLEQLLPSGPASR